MIDYTKKQAFILVANQQLVDWLLSINTHNRRMKPDVVSRLAKIIRENRFILTNQGIGISKEGWIIDGQHRLEAIKAAGYPPVEILIVTGLDSDAQAFVDNHSRRTISDVICLLLDQKVSKQVSSAANVISCVKPVEGRMIVETRSADPMALAHFIEGNQEIIERVIPAIGSKARAAVVAGVIDYARLFDVDAACDFADKVRTGANLSQNDPALRLRAWLEQNKAGGAVQQGVTYSVTASACIHHARGDRIGKLYQASSWEKLPKAKTRYLRAYTAADTMLEARQS